MSNPSSAYTVRLNVPVSPGSRSTRPVFQEVKGTSWNDANLAARAQYGNQVQSVMSKPK